MADLLARFRLIDEMSAKLDSMAGKGRSMTDQIEQAGRATSAALDGIGDAAAGAVSSVDGVAHSVDDAAEATGYWTDKIGNYDKAAMEAIYSTEELVEMGYKTEDALSDAADAADEAADTMEDFGEEAEEAGEKADDAMSQLATTLTSAGIAKMVFEIAEGFLVASKAAAEFEVGMQKISTVADPTRASLYTIQTDLLDLSMRTGIAVGELQEATYSAISASVDTASAVEFTGTATMLAAGGFTTSATAVDVLTTALNAYGLEANKAEYISDLLITTQNLGKTTVDELANSVGKVIPLASAYNVEMDNLSAAYAELTKGGIATAEAGTYLKGMLNELGKTSSTVSTVLREETGYSFAELMEQGYSLGDVMDVLGDSVNGNATAFSNLWSSTEAGVGALALYNAGAEQFNATLDAMQTSAGATASAYASMTDTAAHAEEELSNAAANLQIAIGQNVNPLMEKLYHLGTDITNAMTKFAQEHPVAVKAISAIAVGLGVAAIAIVGVVTVTKVAIPAIVQFGVALNTALGPVGWIAIGLTAATAALVAFCGMMDFAEDETKNMTATTRVQYEEVQRLNDEYEEAVENYGELSEEASRAKYKLDDATAALEANRMTLDEFEASCSKAKEDYDAMLEGFEESRSAVSRSSASTMALVAKLDDLSQGTYHSAEAQQAMKTIIDQLNGSIDGLNLTYSELILNQGSTIERLREMALAQANQDKFAEQMEEYGKNLAYVQENEEKYTRALEDKQAAQEAYNNAAAAEATARAAASKNDPSGNWGRSWTSSGVYMAMEDAKRRLDSISASADQVIEPFEAAQAAISSLEEEWGFSTDKVNGGIEAIDNYKDAVSSALSYVQSDVEQLCADYDAAYEAAQKSFEGQFGLFDKAKADMDATVSSAQEALNSQLTYWQNYGSNIEILKTTSAESLGITQENYEKLMAYAQDGSEQAAGFAASMAKSIQSGNTDAVANMAQTFAAVQEERDKVASTVSEWQVDFDTKMGEIEDRMTEAVEKMNMEDEAKAAAKATIEAYAQAIRDGTGGVVSAAEAAAAAASAALNTSYRPPEYRGSYFDIPGHANGTTYAENAFIAGEEGPELVARPAAAYASGTTNSTDFFIAGENGPELIVGEQGSTVFPTSETDRLIDALNTPQPLVPVYPTANADRLIEALNGQGDASYVTNNTATAETNNIGYSADELEKIVAALAGEKTVNLVANDAPKTDPFTFPTGETDRLIEAIGRESTVNVAVPQDNTPAPFEFPTTETDRLIEGLGREQTINVAAPEVDGTPSFDLPPLDTEGLAEAVSEQPPLNVTAPTAENGSREADAAEQVRKVLVEIAGSGAIEVNGGGLDEDAVLEILMEHIKPALVGIIRGEIIEEGDGSYDF